MIRGKGRAGPRGGSVGSSSRPETGLATSISSSTLESRHPRWAVPSRLSLLLRCLLLPFIEEGEMTNEGGGGCMRDSPRSPKAKTNGSRFEGNRIINPHSRIPKSTNKQTNRPGRPREMPRDIRHVQGPLGRASTARAWDMAFVRVFFSAGTQQH